MSRILTTNRDQWLSSHRDKLLESGHLYLSDGGDCRLTVQGEEWVLELLMKHTEEPVLLLLLEQFYAERFESMGPFPRRMRE
ncbi:hypothetical protein [Gorillibacterium sp. sgz5001074]|uniref:hypothetical protein n=1 Tax=Gorillibacterium sp. sgz5001074 TaxID=3446695 RepID=UPI003F663979